MTVRQSAAARPPDPVDTRRQREFELTNAIQAARLLQARLELLGDRANDVAVVVSLRNSLTRDLQVNADGIHGVIEEKERKADDVVLAGPPCQCDCPDCDSEPPHPPCDP